MKPDDNINNLLTKLKDKIDCNSLDNVEYKILVLH